MKSDVEAQLGLPFGIDVQIIGFMVTWKAVVDGKCHAECSLWVSNNNFLETFHFKHIFELKRFEKLVINDKPAFTMTFSIKDTRTPHLHPSRLVKA